MSNDKLQAALDGLRAETETERLAAARTLLTMTEALPDQAEGAVRAAIACESVPWVRGVLAEVLSKGAPSPFGSGVSVPAPEWHETLGELDGDVARRVINTSTRRVLHEVSAVVGRAKLAATQELGARYATSETKRQLDFLADVCSGLRNLSAATKAPTLAECDLSADLTALATDITNTFFLPILATGPTPFIVTVDPGLLKLAVQNVLVNAVEATLTLGAAVATRPIVLTWGVSAAGPHATVIDQGPGPPPFLGSVRTPGVSTKEGHPGYGLATASEAMRSLDGVVELRRNDRGGTTVVLSWREQAS